MCGGNMKSQKMDQIFWGRPQRLFRYSVTLFLVFSFVVPGVLSLQAGQSTGTQPPVLDKALKLKIIDWICLKLDEIYVFPDVAKKMEVFIRNRFSQGEYAKITDIRQFSRTLSKDMVSVSNDRHIAVRYSLNPSLRAQRLDEEEEKKRLELRILNWKLDNFQFKKIEHLEGNIGYLRFDQFADARWGGDTAVAALQLLGYCDALIIDLRYNGGGNSNMIQLILSYFFDEQKHINSFFIPRENKTEQSYTSSYVRGRRLDKVDLYILTSQRTFSAAEEFTYDLKHMERATVIGETTGGGGHTVATERNDELKIEFNVPDTRAINPVTKTNWEGKGVVPHILCPMEEAFDRAYSLALKNLYEKTESKGNKKQWLKWVWEYQQTMIDPQDVHPDILRSYAGSFGPARIVFEEGVLSVIQPGRKNKEPLLAIDETTFIIQGDSNIRIQFEKDTAGNVVAAYGLFSDGTKQRIPKNK